MNSLKVPDSGLRLMGSGGDGAPAPPQAFFLSLEDNTIENMIKAVQSGQDLTLKLGKEPVCIQDQLGCGSSNRELANAPVFLDGLLTTSSLGDQVRLEHAHHFTTIRLLAVLRSWLIRMVE